MELIASVVVSAAGQLSLQSWWFSDIKIKRMRVVSDENTPVRYIKRADKEGSSAVSTPLNASDQCTYSRTFPFASRRCTALKINRIQKENRNGVSLTGLAAPVFEVWNWAIII